MKKPLPPC